MRLTLGSRSYDLATRALVIATDARALDQGADLVDLGAAAGAGRPQPVRVYARATDEASLQAALAAGADLVHLARPSVAGYRACMAAGVAVVVPDGAVGEAAAAGLPADRILSDALLLDVALPDGRGLACPLAATVAGVIRGARLVRTADVLGARRVCDVLAAIAEAGDR